MLKRLIRLTGLFRPKKHRRSQHATGKVSHISAASIKINALAERRLPPPGNTAAAVKPKAFYCGQCHRLAPAAEIQLPVHISEIVLRDPLDNYLTRRGNTPEDIAYLRRVLAMDQVILETGCGDGGVALEIAAKNPNIGVIASDKYDLSEAAGTGSHYHKVAREWERGCLSAQQAALPNLVILKAEADILRFLPDKSIDTILLINPEPLAGAAFVESLERSGLLCKVRPGRKKIVIKPYSREMNVVACGGFEFDHSEDWSCGLGFILGSALPFHNTSPVQWSVDLSSASPYCKNSTQNCVYVLDDRDCGSPVRPTDSGAPGTS